MTQTTFDSEIYLDLPLWISWSSFNTTGKSERCERYARKMMECGILAFDRQQTIPHVWGYTITFDTEENMTKFMMEYM